MAVVLEDIADKLEESSEHWEQYLNTLTGEFVYLSDGSYVEADHELAEEIENSNVYIRLPNQREIRGFDIMEAFAEATPDAAKSEKLFDALHGRKPFRRFKDTLSFIGMDKAYYAFRFLAYIRIAKEWCERHDIPYTTRKEQI